MKDFIGIGAISGWDPEDFQTLHGKTKAPEERKKQSAKTRRLRLLRAHGLIRKVPRANRTSIVWLWAVMLSLFLTEVILSFFQPMDSQLRLMASGNLSIIGISVALLGGFMGLFVHYQEHFCKKGCPYALIQMLLQSDRTRTMEFANPEKTCTNCRGCDDICPFNLRARFESKGTDCNLCAEACTSELGQGNTLFHLIDPEPRG